MKLRTALFCVGLTIPSAGTLFALAQLRAQATSLRREQQRLNLEEQRLRGARKVCAEKQHELDTRSRELAERLRGESASSEPLRRALLDRGLRLLEARDINSQAAEREAGVVPLVQTKAGKIYFAQLLADPEYSRAATEVERLNIETIYGPLLAKLGFAAADRVQLVELLVEREMAKQDIFGLAEGTSPESAMAQRVDAARRWRTKVRTAFSRRVVDEIIAYDGTVLLRAAVDSLEMRVSATETPLNSSQREQLLAALTTALGQKIGDRTWSIPDRVIAEMQPLLSAVQLDALKQIQEEQRAVAEPPTDSDRPPAARAP